MKRDDDFLRGLLIGFEDSEDYLIIDALVMGMSKEDTKRHYHIQLLSDAGFLIQTGNGTYRMTNQGHDFLASIRDEGIWAQTKEVVAETGGHVALELVKSVSYGFLKKKIEKHAGIEL